MNKERLMTLARFLNDNNDRIKDRFDMVRWGDGVKTTACAAAWGATIPAFTKAGYHLRPRNIDEALVPCYRGGLFRRRVQGYTAIQRFFDLQLHEAMRLFTGRFATATVFALRDDRTPRDVALEIAAFCGEPLIPNPEAAQLLDELVAPMAEKPMSVKAEQAEEVYVHV